MALLGGRLASAILQRYEWHDVEPRPGYAGQGKLEALLGPGICDQIAGQVVSPLNFESFLAVSIRPVRHLHCWLTRELLTSTVRCTLVHRASRWH